jgi:hypothetical protein
MQKLATVYLDWLFRQFGRASMLARLSMLINIVLGWSVYTIHINEDILRREVIACHTLRLEDYKKIIQEHKNIKIEIKEQNTRIDKNSDAIQKIK